MAWPRKTPRPPGHEPARTRHDVDVRFVRDDVRYRLQFGWDFHGPWSEADLLDLAATQAAEATEDGSGTEDDLEEVDPSKVRVESVAVTRTTTVVVRRVYTEKHDVDAQFAAMLDAARDATGHEAVFTSSPRLTRIGPE